MKRTDTHRPSAINPDEYEYVAQECMKIEGLGDCEVVLYNREQVRLHMARTGGTYSGHEHGGNCMVCGSVNAIYTILFYHRPTNTYVRMGEDCARKCDMGGDFDTNAFRAALEDARLHHAGKRKAAALLADWGLTRAWELYLADAPRCTCGWARLNNWHATRYEFPGAEPPTPASPCTCPLFRYEENTIRDIVDKLVRYGSISEKSQDFIRGLLGRLDNRAELDAQREAEHAAAAPCPTGRVKITGTVLAVKLDEESSFGPTTKMLVRSDLGFKVWGTRPSGSHAEKGDRVEFTATVEPARQDPKFGYYKRPTGCTVLERAAETVEAAQ